MLSNAKNKEMFQLINEISNFSHAYLFDTNSLDLAYPYVLLFAKKILCNYHYTSRDQCGDCNICHLIDENRYDDFYLVNPSTVGINKDEIDRLFSNFQNKSLKENGHRVYIIYGLERMDPYVSNKILKFLEEPEANIHALLMTSNINSILSTIKSRCQTIKIGFDNVVFNDDSIQDVYKFLTFLLKNGNKTIAYTASLVFDKFETRADFITFFMILESFFLKEINHRYLNYDSNYDILYQLSSKQVLNMILITNKLASLINNNINLNLLIDRYIMEIAKEVERCQK